MRYHYPLLRMGRLRGSGRFYPISRSSKTLRFYFTEQYWAERWLVSSDEVGLAARMRELVSLFSIEVLFWATNVRQARAEGQDLGRTGAVDTGSMREVPG